VILLAVSAVGLFLFYSGGSFGRGKGFGSEVPRSIWLLLFAIPLVAVLIVIGYKLVLPDIKVAKTEVKPEESFAIAEEKQTLEAVLRVLNPDERKVVETLAMSEGGAMLQKDIRWKTGLSRVKTHRVVARLAERGIVKVEKYFSTNKIALADWLSKKETERSPPIS
jgi:uncharacterized membrane protein